MRKIKLLLLAAKINHTNVILPSKWETTRETPRPELELELATTRTALLEHERVSATMAEGVSLLLLVRVGVVTAVETCAQLGIAEDLVCLVNLRHLLLGCLLGETLLGGLVGMMLLGELAVGGLDLAFIGIVGYPEDLVIILVLAALQGNLGFLHEGVDDVLLVWPRFLGRLEGVDAGFVLLCFELELGLVEETVERVLI